MFTSQTHKRSNSRNLTKKNALKTAATTCPGTWAALKNWSALSWNVWFHWSVASASELKCIAQQVAHCNLMLLSRVTVQVDSWCAWCYKTTHNVSTSLRSTTIHLKKMKASEAKTLCLYLFLCICIFSLRLVHFKGVCDTICITFPPKLCTF